MKQARHWGERLLRNGTAMNPNSTTIESNPVKCRSYETPCDAHCRFCACAAPPERFDKKSPQPQLYRLRATPATPTPGLSARLTRKTDCITSMLGSPLMAMLTKITATRPISANQPLSSASHTNRMGGGMKRLMTLSRKSCFPASC